jgi:class 3 adenylate cyclase
MPIYMDRHNLENTSPEDLARAHQMDLSIQDKYGVNFLTYWFDQRCCRVFCLVDAPDAATALKVHEESHGFLPTEIIEVNLVVVEAFLGRITDPQSVGASNEPIRESAHRVVMFADIVNSVGMTNRLGDAASVDLVRAHDALVRSELLTRSGREVKHTGDGIMAAFADEPTAVACACGIQRQVAAFNRNSANPLQLRIGMHAGEPVADNNDLFGATVQMASRITQDAAVDAVVISHDVHDAINGRLTTVPLGRRMLKGFHEPAPLYAVDWRTTA